MSEVMKTDATPLGHAAVSPAAPFLTLRLSAMMFLEFAIWGAWAVLIAGHMRNLEFTDVQRNLVYLTTAIGALLSPLIAGWIADRFLPNQSFTGGMHLAGAVLLYIAWQRTAFLPLWIVVLCYAVLYMPTIALTNAIAFFHMNDSKKFGYIRVWGTIGWIVINFAISEYLRIWEARSTVSHIGDCLLVAAILSALMGLYCFTLPSTPPSKQAKNPYAFLEALKLTRHRNFAVLLVISFVVAIELPFYYNLTYQFLTEPGTGVGLTESWAAKAQLLGQVAEGLIMLLLAASLRHLGMRTTILLGILAWPVRYAIFAIGQPVWLVVAAQCLHGICYSFFFVGGMIAVERLAHKDIRASAQGLIVFATNGVGMLIGSLLAGQVAQFFLLPATSERDLATGAMKLVEHHAWAKIFLVPIVITVVAGLAFLALFNERKFQSDSARVEAEDAAQPA